MSIALDNQAAALAKARQAVEQGKANIEQAYAVVSATDEWKELEYARSGLGELNLTESEAKQELSRMMLQTEQGTGVSSWEFGKVITRKTFAITDPEATLAWAIDHKAALQVDTKAIKKIADTMHPDGVEMGTRKATRINAVEG